MLKYLYTNVVFQEIPDEVSLAISISGCQVHCKGCHSPELWEDRGFLLTTNALAELIKESKGVTCVCFMGGDAEPDSVIRLARWVRDNTALKTAWYSGRELAVPRRKVTLQTFNYVKTGPYIAELGGLDSKTTNQRLYEIKDNNLIDCTWKLQNV